MDTWKNEQSSPTMQVDKRNLKSKMGNTFLGNSSALGGGGRGAVNQH